MKTTTNQSIRQSAERNAILSSCCGVLGEVTLTDSAVILLFAGILGAKAWLSLLITSLLPLVNGLCIIPMAIMAARVSARKLALGSSALAGIVYFAALLSPWFGGAGTAILVSAIFFFAIFISGFVAGWFPLLDTFLARERRIAFFAQMRFWHQLTSVAFLFIVGLLIGTHPPVETLQAVLFVAALIFIGRALFIARIPILDTRPNDAKCSWHGLSSALANRPLVCFARYVFALNLAAYCVVPLTLLYLKDQFHTSDNMIVMVSAAALAGMFLGYAGVGRMVSRWGINRVFQLAHITFTLVCMILFFIKDDGTYVLFLIAALLLLHSFFIAAVSVLSSSGMLTRADAKNKTLDMALFGAFFYGGQGLSRLISSVLMKDDRAIACWHLGEFAICRYQFVFLLCAVSVTLTALFFKKGII